MYKNITLTKFPRVFVEPREEVKTSSIPANWSTFFGTLAATIPAPRGAGTIRTVTDPHFPVTLQGTVCGFPILLPQYPLLTGITESLANMMAPRIAVATSLEHLTPRPTWPLPSPTTTKALNRVLCPARGSDLPFLNEAAKLCDRHPFLLLGIAAATAATPSSASAVSATTPPSKPASESSSFCHDSGFGSAELQS
nr:ribosomal protein [Ipomoea batatas]